MEPDKSAAEAEATASHSEVSTCAAGEPAQTAQTSAETTGVEAAPAATAAAPVTALVPFRRAPEAPKVEPPPLRDETGESAPHRSRAGRFGLLAASIALAAGIGAAAGAAGLAGINRLVQAPPVVPVKAEPAQRPQVADESKAFKDAVAQMRGSVRALSDSVASLRTQIDGSGKSAHAQFAKLSESIDRLERAQAEPSAKIAKLADALERLERRVAAASAAPAPDTTGAIKPPPLPPLNDRRAEQQVIDGWFVKDAQRGVALVQSRRGVFEVIVGDDIRGVGRVQDIRRRDGQWVVVTSRGLIMPR